MRTNKGIFAGQNDILNANLMMENMFHEYERDGRHKHVFLFKNQVVKVTRDLREAQGCFS